MSRLLDVLGLPAGSRVLDCPCGQGRHAHLLAEAGLEVDAVDYSSRLLTIAGNRRAPSNLRFRKADMRKLPSRWKGRFDAVVNLFTSFGFFLDARDDRKVLAEFARVLSDGGRLVWHGGSRDGIMARFVTIEDALTQRPYPERTTLLLTATPTVNHVSDALGLALTHLWFLYYLCIFYVLALALRWLVLAIFDGNGRLQRFADKALAAMLSSNLHEPCFGYGQHALGITDVGKGLVLAADAGLQFRSDGIPRAVVFCPIDSAAGGEPHLTKAEFAVRLLQGLQGLQGLQVGVDSCKVSERHDVLRVWTCQRLVRHLVIPWMALRPAGPETPWWWR